MATHGLSREESAHFHELYQAKYAAPAAEAQQQQQPPVVWHSQQPVSGSVFGSAAKELPAAADVSASFPHIETAEFSASFPHIETALLAHTATTEAAASSHAAAPPTQQPPWKPFLSTTPDSFNFAYQPVQTMVAVNNAASIADANMLQEIDARLESLRAELAHFAPGLS